jgi:hypothetical protein
VLLTVAAVVEAVCIRNSSGLTASFKPALLWMTPFNHKQASTMQQLPSHAYNKRAQTHQVCVGCHVQVGSEVS